MDSDDDFLPPTQFGLPQFRNNSARSQTVTSSSTQRTQPGTGRPSQAPVSSQARHSQAELSQIQDGLVFLMDRVQQLTGDSRGIKRPADQKPQDKKPNTKEECQLCRKLYANKTTLFRHYRAIHQEMNPEKYHGCSLNNTVVSLDTSLREFECSICGYTANNQGNLDNHNRTVHSTAANLNVNNTNNKENVSNNEVVNVKDKMYKCDECACYFEERNKFDEHMKVQHGFEVVCKICNKNFLFKDIDGHVKDSHPDVYNKKNKVEKNDKVIVEKVMVNRKGKRVTVFTCTKCDYKMYDKIEAQKHARSHRGLKIKAAHRSRTPKSNENCAHAVSNNDYVIFTCEVCNVSTGSYDAAVEHSQCHITNQSHNAEFVTQTCLVCDLKFEPLCYKIHVDLHYKDKEIHKESFKYYKYKFQKLLTEDWLTFFNMNDPAVKKILSESIYAHTRSVKMRVLHEGLSKLYRCCQCDNFVEPATVVNHTVNYDTCVKMKCSYACDICERKFNNRLARDKHENDHNSTGSFKIVLFNNERDKEFNKILNDPQKTHNIVIKPSHDATEVENDNANDQNKVVYKCLCGLCFVRKEAASVHSKICPGKDPKQSCPKCSNFFNTEELLMHCFEHHLNETRIIIKSITPDIIVIESDEEPDDVDDYIIEIESSDEDNQPHERLDNIKIEVSQTDDVRALGSNNSMTDQQNLCARDTSVTEAAVASIENIATQTNNTENDITDEERHDIDVTTEIYGEVNNEMTDDDSQDTVSYENTEKGTANPEPSPTQSEIKCVPTNLLLDPFENRFLNKIDISVLNKEITTNIENVRLEIETIAESLNGVPLNDFAIKEEKPWLYDPTDFSNICRRPSLRQIEMPSTSSTISQDLILETLLTDDEESEPIAGSTQTHNIDTPEKNSSHFVSSNTSLVAEQVQVSNSIEELFNEDPIILHHKDISQNNSSNTEERSVDQNKTVEEDNVQSELIKDNTNQDLLTKTNIDCHGANLNNITDSSINDAVEDNEDYSDDDLFLPSDNINRTNYCSELNNNEKGTSKHITLNNGTEQMSTQTIDDANKKALAIEESENGCHVNIPMDEEEICNDFGSEKENNNSPLADNTNSSKESGPIIETDFIQCNHNENTLNLGEPPKDTVTNNDIPINDSAEAGLTSSEDVTKIPTDLTNNIKTIDGFMNLKIKTELIEQIEKDSENDCDKDLVQIKVEPNENAFNRNDDDSIVITKAENVNYNNCCIW